MYQNSLYLTSKSGRMRPEINAMSIVSFSRSCGKALGSVEPLKQVRVKIARLLRWYLELEVLDFVRYFNPCSSLLN